MEGITHPQLLYLYDFQEFIIFFDIYYNLVPLINVRIKLFRVIKYNLFIIKDFLNFPNHYLNIILIKINLPAYHQG